LLFAYFLFLVGHVFSLCSSNEVPLFLPNTWICCYSCGINHPGCKLGRVPDETKPDERSRKLVSDWVSVFNR
jgi:hypothetical protein